MDDDLEESSWEESWSLQQWLNSFPWELPSNWGLTLVPRPNHNTAESQPCPPLAMGCSEPNPHLRADFLAQPWTCITTMSLPDNLDLQITPFTSLMYALAWKTGTESQLSHIQAPQMLSVAPRVTGWG